MSLQADLGWGKPVRLRGVRLTSPSALGGDDLASADAIYSNTSLWDIIRKQPHDVFVEKARVDASLADNGQLKWMELLDYVSNSAEDYLSSFPMPRSRRINIGLVGLVHNSSQSMSWSGCSPVCSGAFIKNNHRDALQLAHRPAVCREYDAIDIFIMQVVLPVQDMVLFR